MLDIQTPLQLAGLLEMPVAKLYGVIGKADHFYEELVLCDPGKPKPRIVVNPRGPMRALQKKVYIKILAAYLDRSPHSHGGVPGKNVLTNVQQHIGQPFLFTADIADFYPSIDRDRVRGLFINLGCSEEVARICTRICTYKNCLSQGLLTSPILADRLMRIVDNSIAGACRKFGGTYTRFVDDLAISAPFNLEDSGVPALVCRILRRHGFTPHPDKSFVGPVNANASIANIRFHRGHPDVRKQYIDEVLRQLQDAASLSRGDTFLGPYFTQSQLWGRVQFIVWVNPNRRRMLLSRFAQIDWHKAELEAQLRGLEKRTKRLLKKPAPA